MKKSFPVLATAGLLLLALGCATRTKIDWDSRVGRYTFQDAQKEFGEPNHVLRYSDGSRLAEWITERVTTPPAATSSSPGGYGPRRTWSDREGMESLTRANEFESYLHLTFSADDRLTKWDEGKK